MPKNVDKNVDEKKPKTKPRRRVKLPSHVVEKIEKKGNKKIVKWYVRKSISIDEPYTEPTTGEEKFKRVQKQVWKICEPRTKKRAENLLKEIENKINFERTGLVAPLSNVAEICDEFSKLELFPAVLEKGRKVAGRRSLNAPKAGLKAIKDYFGHRNINDITIGEVESFKAARIKTPVEFKYKTKPRAIRTVNIELSYLRQLFNFAYRRRYIDRSPFSDGKEIIVRANENSRHVDWSRDEENRALALCVGTKRAHMKPVIILCADGGFRRSELLNLKWSEVDFKNGVMPARSFKNRNLVTRPVYMTKRMREVLTEWKEIQKTIPGVRDKSLVIGFRDIRGAWAAITSEIGRADMHLHDLRHVFGTRLIRKNVPVKTVSVLLGHSKISTTEIYLNLNEQDLRESIKVLDEI